MILKIQLINDSATQVIGHWVAALPYEETRHIETISGHDLVILGQSIQEVVLDYFKNLIKNKNCYNWVSVEDRLPEVSMSLIVNSKSVGVVECLFAIVDRPECCGEYFLRNSQILWDVTHWMPLPKVPDVTE